MKRMTLRKSWKGKSQRALISKVQDKREKVQAPSKAQRISHSSTTSAKRRARIIRPLLIFKKISRAKIDLNHLRRSLL